MTPKIQIHFIITGNFDPINFSKIMDIDPTIIWKKGEAVLNTKIIRKNDGWKLSTTEIMSYELDIELNKLISTLEPYRSQITNYCHQLRLNIEFSCVIITDGNEFPSICFNKELINKINNFEAEIDIDIYGSLK